MQPRFCTYGKCELSTTRVRPSFLSIRTEENRSAAMGQGRSQKNTSQPCGVAMYNNILSKTFSLRHGHRNSRRYTVHDSEDNATTLTHMMTVSSVPDGWGREAGKAGVKTRRIETHPTLAPLPPQSDRKGCAHVLSPHLLASEGQCQLRGDASFTTSRSRNALSVSVAVPGTKTQPQVASSDITIRKPHAPTSVEAQHETRLAALPQTVSLGRD